MTVFNRDKFLDEAYEIGLEIDNEGEFFFTTINIQGSIITIKNADYFYRECGAVFCSASGGKTVFRKSEI